KVEQLVAVVNTYQALGGGLSSNPSLAGATGSSPYIHTVQNGETFRSISQRYYESERYYKALWQANRTAVPDPDRLKAAHKPVIRRGDEVDQSLIDLGPAPAPNGPAAAPGNQPAVPAPLPPPPPGPVPGPFTQKGTKDTAVQATGGTKPLAASPK